MHLVVKAENTDSEQSTIEVLIVDYAIDFSKKAKNEVCGVSVSVKYPGNIQLEFPVMTVNCPDLSRVYSMFLKPVPVQLGVLYYC